MSKIIASAPLVYYPLNETSGTTAHNYGTLGGAADGMYTGVDLANTPAPGGGMAPFFDGTNDYVNIYSTALRDAFDGNEGSMMIWGKVANAGVWTDAIARINIDIRSTFTNRLLMVKYSSVDTIRLIKISSTVESIVSYVTNTVDWHCLTITYLMGGNLIGYFDGLPFGSIPLANAHAGPINSATIGSRNLVPNDPYHGWLAHAAYWDRVLTPAEALELAEDPELKMEFVSITLDSRSTMLTLQER